MNNLLKTTLIGLFFGTFGTTIGGIIGVTFKNTSKKFLSFVLAFASGLMISIVCFDLIPEAFNLTGIVNIFIGIMFGIVTMIVCDILVDRKKIGFMGRIHPSISKDEIYVLELELDKINTQTKPIKYKEPNKYPKISKDVAFIVNKDLTAGEILEQIKKSGGRLLSNIDVFDIYVGEKLEENKKSIAFNLTFEDQSRTLNDEEVTNVFNKIISDVESKFNAELRNK